ncbi:hypothetical protein LC087_06830 [Bacillus carboniphilus]|uniref:Uncharacterized protein n=1 Tax=Bacillus carboniphilus TaxID=86663 RepID=A0ABY9JZF6_9BACI|nr:hypothetical protein [Bacillus carboniphilus]WLR43830.1 hypothetical protein LC087_06830 [Bacillus carboniphilus]
MTYRPTVRYDERYKKYVDELFKATTLDRNQIIRLALFSAAHSNEFLNVIQQYKRVDVPLPSPSWSVTDADLWRYKSVENAKEKEEKTELRRRETEGRNGQVYERRIVNQGGIRIKLG